MFNHWAGFAFDVLEAVRCEPAGSLVAEDARYGSGMESP